MCPLYAILIHHCLFDTDGRADDMFKDFLIFRNCRFTHHRWRILHSTVTLESWNLSQRSLIQLPPSTSETLLYFPFYFFMRIFCRDKKNDSFFHLQDQNASCFRSKVGVYCMEKALGSWKPRKPQQLHLDSAIFILRKRLPYFSYSTRLLC